MHGWIGWKKVGYCRMGKKDKEGDFGVFDFPKKNGVLEGIVLFVGKQDTMRISLTNLCDYSILYPIAGQKDTIFIL